MGRTEMQTRQMLAQKQRSRPANFPPGNVLIQKKRGIIEYYRIEALDSPKSSNKQQPTPL